MTREAGSSDSVGASCGQALGKCSEIMSHPGQAIIFKSGELKRRQWVSKKGRRLELLWSLQGRDTWKGFTPLTLKDTALHAETDSKVRQALSSSNCFRWTSFPPLTSQQPPPHHHHPAPSSRVFCKCKRSWQGHLVWLNPDSQVWHAGFSVVVEKVCFPPDMSLPLWGPMTFSVTFSNITVYYSGSKHPNYAPPSGLHYTAPHLRAPQHQLRQSSFCLLCIPGYIPPPHTQAVPTFPCCTYFHKTTSPMGTSKNQFRPHCLQQASPSLHVWLEGPPSCPTSFWTCSTPAYHTLLKSLIYFYTSSIAVSVRGSTLTETAHPGQVL